MEQTLKIYFTSDVHGYFYPTTYGDLKRKDLGLFSFARDFKKDENTRVIDGGDILQGSAFAYYLALIHIFAVRLATRHVVTADVSDAHIREIYGIIGDIERRVLCDLAASEQQGENPGKMCIRDSS